MSLFSGIVAPFSDRTISANQWSYGTHTVYDFNDSDLVKDNLNELRQIVATQASKQMDYAVLEQLKAQLEAGLNPPEKTPEEKVIDIVKGGFEKKFGMTIQEFQKIYDDIVENSPEKLI